MERRRREVCSDELLLSAQPRAQVRQASDLVVARLQVHALNAVQVAKDLLLELRELDDVLVVHAAFGKQRRDGVDGLRLSNPDQDL
ncbi:hypothetical protein ACFPRL_25540 [Pseudoclavibacter helvolus]